MAGFYCLSPILSALRPMSPEEIETAARGDRDARPLTDADLKRMRRTPQAKIIRRALELTQDNLRPATTSRSGLHAIGSKAAPNQPACAYLTLIARDPDHVARVLNPVPTAPKP